MQNEQTKLKKGGLIALVTVLGMAPPLSTDMYMPSLPKMAAEFGVPAFYVNMTLIVFFIFMAIGMLILGPMSDRFGRKKILLVSLILYGIGSAACVFAMNVWFMIAVRIVQSLGAGGMVSLSVAIIKDCFDGKTRATVLATVQSMSVIAPIASPVVGAIILQFSTWRTVFIVLTCIAVACIIGGLLFEESIHEDEITDGGIKDAANRMIKIARNRNYTPFLLVVSFFSAPFMGYLAVASYIYEDFFGLSPAMFSIFFAINALTSAFGPMIYMRINSRISGKATMWVLIAVGCAAALAMLMFGKLSPVVFLCTMIPFSIANSYTRPYSTNILLDQIDGDTGAASSLLNFTHFIFGAIGMVIGSLPWSGYVNGIAITIGMFVLMAAGSWIIMLRDKKISMVGIHISTRFN